MVYLRWIRAVSSVGRAPRSHRGGRGFESHTVHQTLPFGAPFSCTYNLPSTDSFVFRARRSTRPDYRFFAGRRYLPDNHILALLPDSSAGIWVKTSSGVSHIQFKRMTLAEKAASFEERITLRHNRYGLVADSTLRIPGDLKSNRLEPNDNDGLWTSMYAAAECFRYATTRSKDALERARVSTEAVLFLSQVTGISGYPARSFVHMGEDGASGPEWHDSQDSKYRWKGDTSSDEIVGHYFLYPLAFDLLPDAALKKQIAATSRAIMDHILSHGYSLVGETGQPTTWGKWSTQYFNGAGYSDSPLNALELLAFLKATAHITGDARYEAEYRKAAFEMGYAKIATTYLQRREEINYSDEELFMLPLYVLARYEHDPALSASYREALEQWWQNEQREKNPLWTFIYAVANPRKQADLAGAANTLQEIPMDLIKWSVINSQRADITMKAELDRGNHRETDSLLPASELPVQKWNSNPFAPDSEDAGNGEDDGAYFLLPYWLGRYHQLLQ